MTLPAVPLELRERQSPSSLVEGLSQFPQRNKGSVKTWTNWGSVQGRHFLHANKIFLAYTAEET